MSGPTPNSGALERSPSECSCETCVNACKRPCWPTPQEAQRIIDAGHAASLMADWWTTDEEPVYLLCGATPGHEGRDAPQVSFFDALMGSFSSIFRGCAFFDASSERCRIHAAGLKPIEGRIYHHDDSKEAAVALHEAVAAAWDTDEGRAVVERWRALMEAKRGER